MLRVIRAELRKLKRPSLSLSTILTVIGTSSLVTSLLFLLIDSPQGNAREGQRISREILQLPSGVVVGFNNSATLLGVVALCIFAAQTAQEYTYGTLRNLLVRQPSRMKILFGKLAAMKLFAIAMVFFSAIVSIGLSYALAPTAKVSTSLWTNSDGRLAIQQGLLNVLISTIGFGLFGMILGLLFRSPISSISVGVIWILIIEGLLSAVVKNIDKYFPGQLLSIVAVGGTEKISYKYALFGSYSILLSGLILVAFLFKRRDVAN